MANVNFPSGFEPVSSFDGDDLNLIYLDVSSTNSEIGLYDVVERRSDGFIHQVQAGSVSIVGVAAERKAANSGGVIAIHPAQGLIMRAQTDDATVDAQTDIGLNYDITVGVPNSVTQRSTMQIDASTQATTATLPINVLRVAPVANNALGANVVLECVFNQTFINGGGTGV